MKGLGQANNSRFGVFVFFFFLSGGVVYSVVFSGGLFGSNCFQSVMVGGLRVLIVLS